MHQRKQEVAHMSELAKQTAVITVVGQDQVGIIARVATLLTGVQVNINDISQTIMQNVFTMIMLVDISKMMVDIKDLADQLEALGVTMGLSIRIQHADIFNAMHRI
jgi:ACT domain-containing protein